METITINKENSQSRVEITTTDGRYFAAYKQGYGWEQVFFGAKTFKTLNGAKKWATIKLA